MIEPTQIAVRRPFFRRAEIACAYGYVLNMRVLCIKMPFSPKMKKRELSRYVRECAIELRQRDISTVCFRDDLSLKEEILACGFDQPDTSLLYRLKMAEILRVLDITGNSAVISADTVSDYDADLLCEAGRRFRSLAVYTDIRGKACRTFNALLRDGVSVRFDPPHSSTERADAVTLLSPFKFPAYFPDNCAVVTTSDNNLSNAVYGKSAQKVSFTPDEDRLGAVPEGFDTEQVLAYALYCGAAPRDGIRVVKAENA